MPQIALATDYDGTIAQDGMVDGPTLAVLARLRAAGWCLVLATGRDLDDLRQVMPRLDLFDRVVAENGAVLHTPDTGVVRLLAAPLPPSFPAALATAGVHPLRAGRVLVATWEVHEARVQAVAASLGLDLRLQRNKGALMALPAGVDKGRGTLEALRELGISPAHCVAVGDAENDLDLLAACGLPVAVANASPALKRAAALVTRAEGGDGVVELIERLLRAGQSWPVPEV
ncbi:HAD family hydrolase [Rubellimicrobium roseum]|uniref:HAD family phosphatase n=1 Tax=Rubellimicrobium roseum TaxID=687525 RepID=A0A5C4N4V2_9RHOB|nr:HAD family hydrolase [Rubellimicrobium roseum]TNC60458.1 HAD family phosphatase [Rubellimicrobium roseum]